MLKHRRLIVVTGSISIAVFFGWLMTLTIAEDCTNLSQRECCLLWGAAIVSVVGGALLLEIFVARKKIRKEWRVKARDFRSDGPVLSSSQAWFRSIARVVLASLLVGLPLIVKGAFVVTVCGVAVGVFLTSLIRGIFNRLPPIEDTET